MEVVHPKYKLKQGAILVACTGALLVKIHLLLSSTDCGCPKFLGNKWKEQEK